MTNDYSSYKLIYTPSRFWSKLASEAKKAGIKVVYVALLLFYVLKDPNVSVMDKAKIYGALGYFILPIDLIPDGIPLVGYSDDLAALLWALHAVWSNVTPDMKLRAKAQLHTWFGDYDAPDMSDIGMYW
jgi:uncharacterized membrane protein YkvA (DUF1232 family)